MFLLLKLKHYALGLTLGVNYFFNAIAGGDPNMTISARSGFARANGSKVGACMCSFLNMADAGKDGHSIGGDHCDAAINDYWRRRGLTIEEDVANVANRINDQETPDEEVAR